MHDSSDLRYDNVAILWENVFILKAALDAFLGVLLLISKSVSQMEWVDRVDLVRLTFCLINDVQVSPCPPAAWCARASASYTSSRSA